MINFRRWIASNSDVLAVIVLVGSLVPVGRIAQRPTASLAWGGDMDRIERPVNRFEQQRERVIREVSLRINQQSQRLSEKMKRLGCRNAVLHE
jgi:hypothetical protein